jgi:excinuclease ABC subunit B
MLAREEESTQELLQSWQTQDPKHRKSPVPALSRAAGGEAGQHTQDLAGMPSAELAQLIQELTDQMKAAAAELHFEVAARLRDEIGDLKKELRQMMEAGAR